jgi:hypothetical protein
LALAAAVQSGTTVPEPALAYGGRFTAVYPPFPVRDVVAYGIVIAWLYRHLRRGSPRDFEALLWQAPMVYVAVSTVVLGVLVLAQGQAAEFVNEHAKWIGLRLAAQFAVGYGYVKIIGLGRNILLDNE